MFVIIADEPLNADRKEKKNNNKRKWKTLVSRSPLQT